VPAAFATAVGTVVSSRVPHPPDPFVDAVVQMGAAGAALVPAALLLGEAPELDLGRVSTRSLVAFVYLVVIGSVLAYSAFVWLLAHTSAATVSTYA
jgi:drug/metabolite transporter (DMT)-like permease